MPATPTHFALLAGVLTGAHGARINHRRHSTEARLRTSKLIAGVPVLNYDEAYGGELSELGSVREEDWNVVMKKGVTNVQIEALCKASNCKFLGHPDQGGMPFVTVRGTEDDLKAAFDAHPGLAKFVEPDHELQFVPEEGGEDPEPPADAATWGLSRIGAPTRSSEGKGANVYVIDSGIRYTHQEFGGRAFPAVDVTNYEVVECDTSDLSCALDGQGHGSHCAGSVAGATFGVAPAAKVHGIKCMTDRGAGEFSWAAAGFDWVVARGARPAVVSMSLGAKGTWLVLDEAIDASVAAGVVVVVAAGNMISDACTFSPAGIPSAITVGSTNRFDFRSGFSNFGDCVDIFAPGSDVKSASHLTDTWWAYKSGTSMSCPAVAGAAALLHSERPQATVAEVLDTMLTKAETGTISGLVWSVNKLLWVGAGQGTQQ